MIFLYFGGQFFSEKPISPSAAFEQTYLVMLYHLFVFSSPAQVSEEREGALSGSRAVSWMGGAGG